jgi:hypothetical protein
MFSLATAGQLDRLDKTSCAKAYGQSYQSARGSVLLVTSSNVSSPDDGALAEWLSDVAPVMDFEMVDVSSPRYDPFRWMCGQYNMTNRYCSTFLPTKLRNISDWQLSAKPLDYCMSEKLKQHCRLEYSAQLLLVVVIIGGLRTITMLYIAFSLEDVPILTIGDAVSSFLTTPDANTKGMCLLDMTLKDYYPRITSIQHAHPGRSSTRDRNAPPEQFRDQRKRRYTAASSEGWFMFLLSSVVLITISVALQVYGVKSWRTADRSDIYKLGLGAIDTRAIISWSLPTSGTSGLLANVVVANIPQLLLSFFYLNYNGLMTVMSLAREWSGSGVQRNGLRVSTNRLGAQRSTYFLQLPYRYSIPIITVTAALHWLLSESIFLVFVEGILFDNGIASSDDGIWSRSVSEHLITCSYSPPAMLASILVASFMVSCIIGMSFLKLPSSMPIASSCSAAIAAACHSLVEDVDRERGEKKLMWGDVGQDHAGIGHCEFSEQEVSRPEEGKLYT